MESVLAVGRGATPAEGICRGILEQGTEATNAPIGPSNELIHGGGHLFVTPLRVQVVEKKVPFLDFA